MITYYGRQIGITTVQCRLRLTGDDCFNGVCDNGHTNVDDSFADDPLISSDDEKNGCKRWALLFDNLLLTRFPTIATQVVENWLTRRAMSRKFEAGS